ncbi:MAG: sensor histidine kinase [Ramlibacter sp.]|nr:sensor histidine kinase [Ramlibacter sp.]
MKIDWVSKLQHMLQVMAFCLAVATIQYGFMPDKPYGPPLLYSLFIGTSTWAIVDLGRHLMPSSRETGWPAGVPGLLLVAGGIAGGYLLGHLAADFLCQTFRLYAPGTGVDRGGELRTSLLITALAGIAGCYWFYSRNRSHYLERKMGEAERHANEARLKLLESQLEPHMLFNTLANLRALISVDPARAQQILDHMIAYLRATLDASRSTTHSLQEEFDRLRDYLELMAIRMGPRLQYTLELPGELAAARVPTLLLQPLVENSIQHGLEPKVEGGRIVVRARRDEQGRLVIEVSDSGVGDAQAASGRKGFGLVQIRERLAALHGAAASLDFRTSGDGASARVLLPIA